MHGCSSRTPSAANRGKKSVQRTLDDLILECGTRKASRGISTATLCTVQRGRVRIWQLMSAARDRLNTGARVSGLWAVVRRWLSDLRAAAPRDLRHCRVRRTRSTGPGLARGGSRTHCRGQRCASSPSCLGGTPARSRARGPSSCRWAARTPRDRRIALLGGNRGSDLPVAGWNGRDPTFLVSNRRRPAPTTDHQPTTRCGQGSGELSASDSTCNEPRSTAGEDVSPGASDCRRGEVRGESVSDRYPDHPSRRHVGRGPMENGELEWTACVRLGSTRPAPDRPPPRSDHDRDRVRSDAFRRRDPRTNSFGGT